MQNWLLDFGCWRGGVGIEGAVLPMVDVRCWILDGGESRIVRGVAHRFAGIPNARLRACCAPSFINITAGRQDAES